MKILIVCSSPYVKLEPVMQLLENAGLAKALNSKENKQSFEQWHEQVFDAYEQDSSGLLINQPLKPGKVWQDMAGQLIHANLSKKQWVWSASKAGWLLDFWHELEPQHRFAMLYSPPQVGISQCLPQVSEQSQDLDSIIKSWMNYHLELLRFYRSHQEQCILVNVQKCLAFPDEFIRICKHYLSFDFEEQLLSQIESSDSEMQYEGDVLFHLIAKQYPDINNLFQELEASATPFEKSIERQQIAQNDGKKQLEIIWQERRRLKTQQAEEDEIRTQLQQTLDSQISKTQKIESEKKQEILVLQENIKKLEVEIKQQNEKEQYSQQNQDSETENELLLLQLHQVQEELEHYFLKYQELEQQTKSNGIIAFIEQNSGLALKAQLIQVKQESNSIRIELMNLQWQEQTWPRYYLYIIPSSIIYDQTSQATIKLPLQSNNFLPLKTWPPQTADESGAYWAINNDLLEGEMTHSNFYPEDIAFLHALLEQLPQWLKTLENNVHLENSYWSEYYQVIEAIKPVLDNVFEFQQR